MKRRILCRGLCRDSSRDMRQRTRKFIGTMATIVFLASYSLVAMAIGGQWVVGKGPVTELVFYVLAGILWLPVAMAIIRWMSRA